MIQGGLQKDTAATVLPSYTRRKHKPEQNDLYSVQDRLKSTMT